LTRQADARAASDEPVARVALEYATRALPMPVPILVGEVTTKTNPLSGVEMTVMIEDAARPVKMLDYGLFAATRSVRIPKAYIIPREEKLRPVIENLRAHGIQIEELKKPLTVSTETFTIESLTRTARAAQGHRQASINGRWTKEQRRFEPGTWRVTTTQALGLLAAFLLEPESDDGLVAWNLLDPFLERGKVVPIYKLMQ